MLASDGYVPIVSNVTDVPASNAQYTELNFNVSRPNQPMRSDQDQLWAFFLRPTDFNKFDKIIHDATTFDEVKRRFPGRCRKIEWNLGVPHQPSDTDQPYYTFDVRLTNCGEWSEQDYSVYLCVLEPGNGTRDDIVDLGRLLQ